jgi:hypothetical protein
MTGCEESLAAVEPVDTAAKPCASEKHCSPSAWAAITAVREGIVEVGRCEKIDGVRGNFEKVRWAYKGSCPVEVRFS